jgi:Phage capsid family
MKLVAEDPFLPGQALRAEPSYQEVPTAEAASLRALSDEIVKRIWGVQDPNDPDDWLVQPLSPWRQYVQASLLPADITRYQLGRGASASAPDPTIQVTGPSGFVTAFDLRSDHVAVSPPADITWTGTATITPRETLALATISNERLTSFFLVNRIDPNGDLVTTRSAFDPAIVNELADALNRRANVSFINSVASTTDPRTGVVSFAGITTTAAGSQPYVADAINAVENLRSLKRYPNVIFAPWSLVKLWRLAQDTTGGFLFDPAEPLSIDGVVVVGHDGISAGGSTFFLVGDFERVKALFRLMPNGRLISVAYSADQNFNSDQTTFRLIERWDQNLTPGYGPSIVQVTGVNAP